MDPAMKGFRVSSKKVYHVVYYSRRYKQPVTGGIVAGNMGGARKFIIDMVTRIQNAGDADWIDIREMSATEGSRLADLLHN